MFPKRFVSYENVKERALFCMPKPHSTRTGSFDRPLPVNRAVAQLLSKFRSQSKSNAPWIFLRSHCARGLNCEVTDSLEGQSDQAAIWIKKLTDCSCIAAVMTNFLTCYHSLLTNCLVITIPLPLIAAHCQKISCCVSKVSK